jgi:hypothetical protein
MLAPTTTRPSSKGRSFEGVIEIDASLWNACATLTCAVQLARP